MVSKTTSVDKTKIEIKTINERFATLYRRLCYSLPKHRNSKGIVF